MYVYNKILNCTKIVHIFHKQIVKLTIFFNIQNKFGENFKKAKW